VTDGLVHDQTHPRRWEAVRVQGEAPPQATSPENRPHTENSSHAPAIAALRTRVTEDRNDQGPGTEEGAVKKAVNLVVNMVNLIVNIIMVNCNQC
jgi:hypothetical protein